MPAPVICIGATLVDELYFCSEKTVAATSNPAVLKRYAGGVARNIAHHLALLGIPVQLVTVLGNDPDGNWLKNECIQNGIGTDVLLCVDDSTGKYASIINTDGSLYVAACTDLCDKYLTPGFLEQQEPFLSSAKLIIAETNLPGNTLEWIISFCDQRDILLFIEPVSVAKAKKMAMMDLSGIFMITPNEDELPSLCNHSYKNSAEAISELLQRGVKNIWLRKGAEGSEIFTGESSLVLPAPVIHVKDSTGAGDAALAGWVAAYCMGMNKPECMKAGHAMALEVLQVKGAIATSITKDNLITAIKKYYPDET